jgi:hypothetical protein
VIDGTLQALQGQGASVGVSAVVKTAHFKGGVELLLMYLPLFGVGFSKTCIIGCSQLIAIIQYGDAWQAEQQPKRQRNTLWVML